MFISYHHSRVIEGNDRLYVQDICLGLVVPVAQLVLVDLVDLVPLADPAPLVGPVPLADPAPQVDRPEELPCQELDV